MTKDLTLPMNLQYFADPTSDDDTTPQSSAVDVEALQRELANVKAQRNGLLAKAKQSQASASASQSAPASSAQPAPSANSQFDLLQSQLESLKAQNSQFAAEQATAKQREAFTKQAQKDSVSLSSDDLDMIIGSSDQNKAYKYITALKGGAPKHPNKDFPSSNSNTPSSNSDPAGLFKGMNRNITDDALNQFIPGRH